MDERFIVRAIDVGYGHTKYTKGRDARGILCAHFPSLAPLASDRDISGGVMARRDTVVVEFGGARYEVGNDVELALGPAHNRMLDEQFSTSERYMALVQGALHYISEPVIDVLVAGLPVELYRENRRTLEERLIGEYEINGRKVRVRKSLVLPQPIGGYVSYASETSERWRQMQSQMNLVIDIGFCTVDWVTGLGTKTSDARSGSYPGGVAVVLRHVAQSIAKKLGKPFSDISMLDAALRKDGHLRLFGKDVDLRPHLDAAEPAIVEAVQAITASVGSGYDIQNIIISGGGAKLYRRAIERAFPDHTVEVGREPAFANARGFHIAGEEFARKRQ